MRAREEELEPASLRFDEASLYAVGTKVLLLVQGSFFVQFLRGYVVDNVESFMNLVKF